MAASETDALRVLESMVGDAKACVARIEKHIDNINYVTDLIEHNIQVPHDDVQLVVKIGDRTLRLSSAILGEPGIMPLYPTIVDAEDDELSRQVASLYALVTQLYDQIYKPAIADPPGPEITPEALNAARHAQQPSAAPGDFTGNPRAG